VSLSIAIELRVAGFDLEVAFDVGDGLTALFGPSGAGKTLTLRAIAGLATPRTGRIVASGRTLFDAEAGIDVPPRERGIGYLFQQYALFPHLSVERNIAYGLGDHGAAERKDRVSGLLDLVGLAGYERRRPGALSGGEQQRVALARALAPGPRLLLLDEPFAAVDLGVRRRLRAELRRIQEATSTPMLLVTHDLSEVRQLSDSLVVLDRGRVVAAGSAAAVLADPGRVLADLVEGPLDGP
jgi:molybdate transport system ATP-binding protein